MGAIARFVAHGEDVVRAGGDELGDSAQRRATFRIHLGADEIAPVVFVFFGLGQRLAIPTEEAAEILDAYFVAFPSVKSYMEATVAEARERGYTETLFGRRRYFPIFKTAMSAANRQAVMRAEREAVNHPIQGTAADIIKIAMIRLHEQLRARFQARMVLQVHDELLLELPREEVEAVRPLVVETMCDAFELDAPLRVEAEIGANWLELKS